MILVNEALDYYFPHGTGAKQNTLPEIDLSSTNPNKTTVLAETYNKLQATNMSFAGEIPCNLRMYGDNLSHDTLVNVISHLKDYTNGDTHILQVGSASLSRLSDEEIKVGTDKNWTIS